MLLLLLLNERETRLLVRLLLVGCLLLRLAILDLVEKRELITGMIFANLAAFLSTNLEFLRYLHCISSIQVHDQASLARDVIFLQGMGVLSPVLQRSYRSIVITFP